MHPTDSALVEATGVTKSYGDLAVLTGLDCRIGPGITGLLGANGSGKTTFLGLLLGLHRPDAGNLTVFGHDPSTQGADIRQFVGYGPEHHTLPPQLRAADFVRHIAELHGIPASEAVTRASDALWLVDLGEERFRPLGTMSTGQRQRVKLAQAIAHDPRLVLLDEPTDGLDPAQRTIMLDLIRTVATQFGISMILSSHLIDEVERICDHVVVIGRGQVVASGSIEEIRADDRAQLSVEIDGSAEQMEAVRQDLLNQTGEGDQSGSGAKITLEGRELNVVGGEGSLESLYQACARHDVGIVRLQHRKRSLEDVFVEYLS